jgi:hypothetical protein
MCGISNRTRATQPIDKVYVYLGLAFDTETLGIIPYHSKTVQEIYTRLARTLIQHGFTDIIALR